MDDAVRMVKLKRILEALFESQREEWRDELPPDEFERRKRDFVFHMTDWKTDLDGLARLFHRPDANEEDAAHSFLIGFLYHVVPHLGAAARLLLGDIGSPFPHPDDT